ncbi:S-adenosylmethionine decarboxylase family protein [Salinactinospora qingdaonensis]|uniref:S-adenosylmethionine decarboxylase n=1 Tax=Salinactinospora qingdaonensis TaxID=702744 RepID=A0ABP7ET36_9ACTN
MVTETETTAAGNVIGVDELCSYAVDISVTNRGVLTDEASLRDALRRAARAGEARILGESSHIFANGAVTIALVLSKSHLSIHTWPEFSLANIDFLTYGRRSAEAMLAEIRRCLSPARVSITRLSRAAP